MTHAAALLVAHLVCGLGAPALTQLSREVAVARTEGILRNFQEGRIAEIRKEFDARMLEALPEEKIKPVWPAMVAQFGAFKTITERREGEVRGRQAVELILAFEKETIVNRAVFDAEGKVAGLVFQPLANALLPPPK
jgi:hypothetical protein